MANKTELITGLASLVLKCEDLVDEEWEQASFVFDVRSGSISNSGFIYRNDKAVPAIADIDEEPLSIDNKVLELQQALESESHVKFKQLLIQLDKNTGKFKIEFEFDTYDRWTFEPKTLSKTKQEIRPNFN